jgi:AsmA family
MTNGATTKERVHRGMRMALAGAAILLFVLVVPPLISVNRYKGQITGLISRSLGRPVHLSSVQVHLLPWPGFELTDLSVAEDPAYGAEPVLHANKVTASLRLLALWRGRLEIGKISVDEASLNLVRAAPGRWNLDPIFRTAAAQTGSPSGSHRAQPLPYLEATDSRINFKNGVEKLPFSLVDADLSFWQESDGEWRVRLAGQPARTDVSLFQEETGLVRMEARVRRAPALRQMPLHVDLDWRQARLGQLARLITGSDPGWRGDLTGELHLDGTADAAQVTVRLGAADVHRAEFTPQSPLDFDANCNFVIHYTRLGLEKLACDSPLGGGRVRVTGEKPDRDAPGQFTTELDRIPVAAALDALRTFRSGLAPDLEVKGTASGKIVYNGADIATAEPQAPAKSSRIHASRAVAAPAGPLAGNLILESFALSGGGLGRPVQIAKMTLEPVAASQGSPPAMAGTASFPAGGTLPLTVNVRLSLSGYQVGLRGQASFVRARELAHAAGIPGAQALAALAGDPLAVDLTAQGDWLPPEQIPLDSAAQVEVASASDVDLPAGNASGETLAPIPGADTVTGTITLHNANWRADYLAGHVVIDEATIDVDDGALRWDSADFTYGPVKGTASLMLPTACSPEPSQPKPCPAEFMLRFADLDAAVLENALLGAREKGTMLSTLIERFHPSSAPPWPRLEGKVSADSLALGPVTLENVAADIKINPDGAEITSLDADLLGGSVHLTGSLEKPATDRDKPGYTFEGAFDKLNAASVGALVGLRWTGSSLDGNGKLELSGYTGEDFSASAKGSLHFECRRGAIADEPGASSDAAPLPVALDRFDRWSADASIADGAIELGENQLVDDSRRQGSRKQSVEAKVSFGDPPVVSFPAAKEVAAKRR